MPFQCIVRQGKVVSFRPEIKVTTEVTEDATKICQEPWSHPGEEGRAVPAKEGSDSEAEGQGEAGSEQVALV